MLCSCVNHLNCNSNQPLRGIRQFYHATGEPDSTRRVALEDGGTIMRSKALKAKEAEQKLTLAEGIGIIIALAVLGGLTFGVVAV